MSLIDSIRRRFTVKPQSRKLAVREDDNTFYTGQSVSGLYRDRYEYDRQTILSECLRAWRVNPIARRLVKLTTQFVIGEGMTIESKHKATNKFLQEWWTHPLNQFDSNLPRWMDEQTRAGNLFFLFSVDGSGMSYVRAVPADLIKDIQTADNDVEQETFYIPIDQTQSPWPAFNPNDSEQTAFMRHYAVNQPVGVPWGEPDLAPLLPWIGRFTSWLADRALLNRFRNAFLYVVRGQFNSTEEKQKRQAELNANPPASGSILVTDPSEEWGTLSPNLDAFDATADGLSLKKMLALGAGIPMHYLAEPESTTRTTAEAAGTPTFRNFEQIQTNFVAMLEDMAHVAVILRNRFDHRVRLDAEITVKSPDITERDNTNLALAANRIWPVVTDMFDREMLEAPEALRLIYRMAGELYEQGEIQKVKGIRRPLKPASDNTAPAGQAPDSKTDPDAEQPDQENN